MARKSRRPKSWSVGPVRVRVIRGPHKEKGWYFRAEEYRDGQSFTLWTGWAVDPDEVTRQVAWLVAKGEQAEPGRRSPGERMETVRDLMEVWVAAQEDRSDIAVRTKKLCRAHGRLIVRALGDVSLTRLDVTTLEGYRDMRLALGISSQGLCEELKAVCRAYRWAQARAMVDSRSLPMPRLKLVPKRVKVTPTPDEFWKVHAWIRANSRRAWLAQYLQILGSTGCRANEVSGLVWSDVDLDRKVIQVSGKTGRRDVIIPDSLAAMFAGIDRSDGDERVLKVAMRTIADGFGVVMSTTVPWAELGVKRFTPQGVRRMVVDQLYGSGADIGVVAQHLGHSPQVALKYYRQATHEEKARALALAGVGRVGPPQVVRAETADDPHN